MTGRVLIVDDEINICEACLMILGEMGHQAAYCLTGGEGLDKLLKENWDIVLLDMKLPDMEGMEVIRRLRKDAPQVLVVVMTGYATVDNAVRAMKSGAFDYLAKPFAEDTLTRAVNKALSKAKLSRTNQTLRVDRPQKNEHFGIVGESPAIKKVFRQIEKVASTGCTILLYGESGTGKELMARAIHQASQVKGEFIPLDCSTIAQGLLESELFGHARGAFTGATHSQAGVLESVQDGTLFLDEVSNLSLDIQAKLLRVLETGEFKPVGLNRVKKFSARIIAATNRELSEMVRSGEFREDLYYRLNVFPLDIPPLRERKGDIPLLAYHFLRFFCDGVDKLIRGFTDEALDLLVNYDWPGNVRQLKNAVERLIIMIDEPTMDIGHLGQHLGLGVGQLGDSIPRSAEELMEAKKRILNQTFGAVQKAFVTRALAENQGNVSLAARSVGMQRSNFSALMKKQGIDPESFKTRENETETGV